MKAISIKSTARIAGLLYLLQIPLGVFGIIYIPKSIVVPGNMVQTTANVLEHEFLFRLSIVSALLCALVTIGTAYYLYKVLRQVNEKYAWLMVLCTLVVAPISMFNELNHIAVLLLLKNPAAFHVFSGEQLNTLVFLFFDLHHYGIQVVGIFFGLWLLPMAYLVYKSTYIPKFIGVFLFITCLGYLIDFLLFFLFPKVEVVLSEYTWLGELMMVLWLLIKGVNVKQWEKQAIEIENK
jgi:hypothetical protein